MFFLNFTAGEFLVLFATFAGIVTALYLFDRSKSKKIVSTLRFWTLDVISAQQKSRKRMRDPWSFLLQILSILLLLLAIGQLEWGRSKHRHRKDVVLVDTSAWSSEALDTNRTVLDAEKKIAAQYIKGLPATDLVLLAGVDASAVPATVFTSNRAELLNALESLQPSYSALDLGRALSFARRAAALSGSSADISDGEVLYVGPGRIRKGTDAASAVQNFRAILVPATGENCGIRSVGIRRDSQNPELWNAVVSVENYGTQQRVLQLTSRLSGKIIDSRSLNVTPRDGTTAEFSFTRATEGQLAVSLEPGDALRADDRAVINVPGSSKTRLAVFTTRPAVVKPLIRSDENLEASFFTPAQYTPRVDADVVLLDQFAPAALPQSPSVWITPPRDRSPIPVAEVVDSAVLSAPNVTDDLHTAMQNRSDVRVRNAEVFTMADGDSAFATIAKGPVAVGHEEHSAKFAAVGFDPFSGDLRFQSATPVLFSSLMRWLSPESMRASAVATGFAGETTIPLPFEKEGVSGVDDENGAAVPFNVQGRLLQVSANSPSQLAVHFLHGGSILLPVLADVAEEVWTPTGGSATGLPSSRAPIPADVDLWKWLAFLGGLGFLADWLLFGRKESGAAGAKVEPTAKQADLASELVQQ